MYIVDELVKQGDVVVEIYVKNEDATNFVQAMTGIRDFDGWQKVIQEASVDQEMGPRNNEKEHEKDHEKDHENENEDEEEEEQDNDVNVTSVNADNA